MFTLLILSFILITFIYENHIVSSGATYGLMLWYQDVLPLLLPFMLISGLMETKIKEMDSNSPNKAIYSTLFLGLLCGYPIGAKTTASFVKDNTYENTLGNILLPICNNVSPMFLSGYIAHIILKDAVPLYMIIVIIFVPYIIYVLFMLLINKAFKPTISLHNNVYKKEIRSASLHNLRHANNQALTKPTNNNDLVENSITQITFVGFYIMLCSIGIELILNISFIPDIYKFILSGMLEITRGTDLVSSANIFSDNIKTALIISLTSFGGISSILQTGKVIKKSGLSLSYYIIIKLICSVFSFYLGLLLI